jgi:hypothetical protein
MSGLYACGILFTCGFMYLQESDETWKSAFIGLFLCLLFPVFWGLVVAMLLKGKHESFSSDNNR